MNKLQYVTRFLDDLSEEVPQFIKSQEHGQNETYKNKFNLKRRDAIKPCITFYDRPA